MRTIVILAAATIFVAGCGDKKKSEKAAKNGAAPENMEKEMERMNEMMIKHLGEADSEYDHRFIDLMIPHHEGAIMMAKHALENATGNEVKEFAKKIVDEQQKEIEQLKKMQEAAHEAGHGDHKSHGKEADR